MTATTCLVLQVESNLIKSCAGKCSTFLQYEKRDPLCLLNPLCATPVRFERSQINESGDVAGGLNQRIAPGGGFSAISPVNSAILVVITCGLYVVAARQEGSRRRLMLTAVWSYYFTIVFLVLGYVSWIDPALGLASFLGAAALAVTPLVLTAVVVHRQNRGDRNELPAWS